MAWSRCFSRGDLERRLVRLRSHPVQCPPYRRLLHKAPLEPTLTRKVEQHQTNQDSENALPREHQHGDTDEHNANAEPILAKAHQAVYPWRRGGRAGMREVICRKACHYEGDGH
jgi:hypothetical protein